MKPNLGQNLDDRSGPGLAPGLFRALCAALVCCSLCLLPGRAPAAGAQDGAGNGADGGAALLHALWTPEQLAGTPGERRQGPTTPPDDSPPSPEWPRAALPPLPASESGADAATVRRVELPPDKRLVALTFDLCELADRASGYDGEVVDLLRREGTPATFFLGGRWMRSHPERTMQLMADPLFAFGNHAWTHGNMAVLDAEKRREQLLWTQAEYETLRERLAARAKAAGFSAAAVPAPAELTVFRPPYGRCSADSMAETAKLGLRTVTWDVVTAEMDKDAAAAARDVAERARSGSIILMHANGVPPHTARILADLLPLLRARGLTPVTLPELLSAGTPELSRQCYFNHPGDNLSLDKHYGDGTRHPLHAKKAPRH
ncbi:polysaccharide deacetylase [Desulfovibrio sp. X2]|uniref:polysaccharide deacetylase family protein n=1 Tax=Desulfovibrio sp. X2 TaxID=941449 RepID=UPI000358CCD3|nr:polysaccharide deacetylase family protein [Desulfovibrio sp. X2]EPR41637.1 polysaccharide deacetylase [Desulfovibrio sp. X2]